MGLVEVVVVSRLSKKKRHFANMNASTAIWLNTIEADVKGDG